MGLGLLPYGVLWCMYRPSLCKTRWRTVNINEELVSHSFPSFSFPFMLSFSYIWYFFSFSFLVANRIWLCLVIYRTLSSSMFLLLFFEPFSIAFETMQVMLLKHVLEFVWIGWIL